MDGEFKHLEDFLAAALKEKAVDPRTARVRALIHLAKVTRAEIAAAIADVEKRIEQCREELSKEPNRRPFLEKVLGSLGSARRKHDERLIELDEFISRAQKAEKGGRAVVVVPPDYDWDHNPASILDTIDLHLRFRLFRRSDQARQQDIEVLAARLGILPSRVRAAVDAVGVVDPRVRASSPKPSAALRILWNLHRRAGRTSCTLPALRRKTAELVKEIQEALEYLWPASGESVPVRGTRDELVILLAELFRIEKQTAEGLAARLLDKPSARIVRA